MICGRTSYQECQTIQIMTQTPSASSNHTKVQCPTSSLLLDILISFLTQYLCLGIDCYPAPGPFLPCNDLFDWWTLRCGVWVVFLLALLGNGCVVVVLSFSRNKMDVPRFLVCNLAAADFFMGLYLGRLSHSHNTTPLHHQIKPNNFKLSKLE